MSQSLMDEDNQNLILKHDKDITNTKVWSKGQKLTIVIPAKAPHSKHYNIFFQI